MSVEYLDGLICTSLAPTVRPWRLNKALDLVGETYGTETDVIVLPASRFSADFFDLSSRQAGLFFQKIQNYRLRLVIIGDLSNYAPRKAE